MGGNRKNGKDHYLVVGGGLALTCGGVNLHFYRGRKSSAGRPFPKGSVLKLRDYRQASWQGMEK